MDHQQDQQEAQQEPQIMEPQMANQDVTMLDIVEAFETSAVMAADALNVAMCTDEQQMRISDQERGWARELKALVESSSSSSSSDHATLTDMQYAQHAICSQGSLAAEVTKIAGMQEFCKKYGIDNTVNQGVMSLQAVMAMQPGWLVHLDVDGFKEDTLTIMDWGVFDPKAVLAVSANPGKEGGILDNWAIFIRGLYYLFYTCQPTIAVVRNGLMSMSDMGDYGWENFDMEVQHQYMAGLFSYYPMRYKSMIFYDAGIVTNCAINLVKPFMPPDMRKSIQLGCKIGEEGSDRRLKDLYFQPSRQDAEEAMLSRARNLLLIRVHHEQTFRL